MAKKQHEKREAAAAADIEETEPEAAGERDEDTVAEVDTEAAEPPEPEELSVEEILRRERDEFQDRLLRAVAELDNLRKRTRREVDDARRFAAADVLRPLLDVQDNFTRALQTPDSEESADASTENPAGAAFRQGVELIAQNFQQVLHERGVRRIDAEGQPFDPAVHEAVGQTPAPDESTESGTVLHVIQQGYTLDGMVIRPSRVIVAQ